MTPEDESCIVSKNISLLKTKMRNYAQPDTDCDSETITRFPQI